MQPARDQERAALFIGVILRWREEKSLRPIQLMPHMHQGQHIITKMEKAS